MKISKNDRKDAIDAACKLLSTEAEQPSLENQRKIAMYCLWAASKLKLIEHLIKDNVINIENI